MQLQIKQNEPPVYNTVNLPIKYDWQLFTLNAGTSGVIAYLEILSVLNDISGNHLSRKRICLKKPLMCLCSRLELLMDIESGSLMK